jgi:hypothetical protein
VSTRPVIRLKAGNDRTVRIAVQDASGAARNLSTDEEVRFRAAPILDAAAATIDKTDGDGVVIVDAALGLIDVVFTRAETLALTASLLLWEVKITEADGDVITLDFGAAGSPQTYGVLLLERPLLLAG